MNRVAATNEFKTNRYYLTIAFAALATITLIFQASLAQARSAPESFADLAEELLPLVVNISSTTIIENKEHPNIPQLPPGSPFEDFFKDFFNRNQPNSSRRATSLGSGFIVSDDGYVVTNNHVIEGADEIFVTLHDNTQVEAELIGRDPKSDLAVLKIDVEDKLKFSIFGNSDKSRVGDWVVAIGNPFGLGGTLTAGIISARGRDINSGPYDDFIQTDASINRGNSGGPMFNMDGEVIGVNTAILSPSGGSVGIGFSIPSNAVSTVIDQLIKHGEVKRGWLGVHIQAVSEEIAETLGLEEPVGALVANVMEGGPAEEAKIKPGDVILEFNDVPVSKMRRLPKIVAETEVGREVDVIVWRDGEKITLRVSVGQLDDEQIAAAREENESNGSSKVVDIDALGMSVAAINDEVRERFDLAEDSHGVIVVAVENGGNAAEKGMRPGDLIVEVSKKEINKPSEILTRIKEARKAGRKSILLLVEAQAGLRYVGLNITKEE